MQLLKKVLNFSSKRYLKTASDLFIYHSDYPGALEQIEKSLEIDPNDTRALVLYGDILFCLNRDVEALHALNKAVSLDGTLPEAQISKAGVLEVLGKYREALNCCHQALNLIDTEKQYLFPSLFDQKIILLIRLKRFRQAQQVLADAVNYLEQDDYDYLSVSYRSLLEQFCQHRQKAQDKAKTLSLRVLDSEVRSKAI